MLNTSCIWYLLLQQPPLVVTYQKGCRATELPDSITGLLTPVYETMQDEEIKILPPLFFIADFWLQALALYKPLDCSWHPTPVLLPGKSHGQRSLVGCSPWGCEESDTTERLRFHFSLWCIGEGNGNPLQCSCLENPRDGGAWWAAVYGVAHSRTRLKRLSSSSSSRLLMEGGVFRHEPTKFHSLTAENKSHLSISSKFCFRIFHSALVGREGQDFDWQ